MRKLVDIKDYELDQLRDALGLFDPGEGILTRQEFTEAFIDSKSAMTFDTAVKAYKWFVKNNFEI